jgi:hypothetical protein
MITQAQDVCVIALRGCCVVLLRCSPKEHMSCACKRDADQVMLEHHGHENTCSPGPS